MKHRLFVTFLVLFLVCGCAFAQAVKEQQAEEVKFSSLDLESASLQKIIETFEAETETYNAKRQSIYDKMAEAYSKGDADDYFDAKGLLKNLEAPKITAEQTDILVTRILNEKDDTVKTGFATWLYRNSDYYNPKLTFTKNSSSEWSLFNYTYSVTEAPGSTVVLPELYNGMTRDGLFTGWGYTTDEAIYQPGEEIEMPYESQTLYAVFKSGVLFTDPITGTEVFEDGNEINAPELTAPDDSYVFVGWYDMFGVKADGSQTLEEGESCAYTAKWKSVRVLDVYVKNSSDLTVPADKAVKINFSILNQGNADMGRLSISLVAENGDSMKISNAELNTYNLVSGQKKSGSFTVTLKGNEGDVVKANIVITDTAGNTWTQPVELTIAGK